MFPIPTITASTLSWDGTFVTAWNKSGGGSGSGPGEFSQPDEITTNSTGDVFVADTINDRIQIFEPEGTFIGELGSRVLGTVISITLKGLRWTAAGTCMSPILKMTGIQKFSLSNDPSMAGIFRSGLWGLDYNGNFAWDGGDRAFTIGLAGDIPVTGDWNRDGKDEIGIFRSGTWALDFNGNCAWDAGDKAFVIGQAGDIPVVGDWNDNGNDSVGIYRNGLWGLDYNDNYAWDGADKAFYLGTTGDIPVVGDWDASGGDSAGIFRNGLWGSGLQRQLRMGRGRQGIQPRYHRR